MSALVLKSRSESVYKSPRIFSRLLFIPANLLLRAYNSLGEIAKMHLYLLDCVTALLFKLVFCDYEFLSRV